MNLKNLHKEDKPVQTSVLFNSFENKTISLQIKQNELLKEHITKVPTMLICISGNSIYEDENGIVIDLINGDFVKIEPNVKHWVKANETSNFLLIK